MSDKKGESMNTRRWLRCILFSMMAGFVVEVNAQTNSVPPPAEPEKIDGTITKVYSAQDGDARFRAYAVKWNNQEIVVIDPLSNTSYKEGDIISAYVYRGDKRHRTLPQLCH